MAGKWNGKRCSTCAVGTLHDDVRERVNEYRGESFRAIYPGAFCDRCGDGMIYHDPQIDDEWEAFCEQVDADERRELAAIRGRLGLTQEEASKLSGGGHNAFSRYERGEARPMIAVVNLFRLLDRYPSLLAGLAAAQGTRSFSFTYSVSKPATEGWCSTVTATRGAGPPVLIEVPLEQGNAANEWQLSTNVTALVAEAA